MCVRFSPLTAEEAQAVFDARGTGRHGIRFIEHPDPIHDARPGSTVPLFVPDGSDGLRIAKLEWGFPLDSKSNAVFNTRIESALEQIRRGRRGMWAKAIAEGRCLVPVRAFYESSATEKVFSKKTGSPSAANTASACPVPARSCSPPSSRTAASPSSPRCPLRAARTSTTARPSSSAPASRACGLGRTSRASRTAANFSSAPEPKKSYSTRVKMPYLGLPISHIINICILENREVRACLRREEIRVPPRWTTPAFSSTRRQRSTRSSSAGHRDLA